jgi:hypothetical protein
MITGFYNYETIKIDIDKIKIPSLITIKNSFIKLVIVKYISLAPSVYENKIILPKLKAGHLLYFKRFSDYDDIGPYIFYKNLLPDIENLKYALDIGLIDDIFYNYWINDLEIPLLINNQEISLDWKNVLNTLNNITYSYKYTIPRRVKEDISNNPLNFYLVIIGTIFSFMSVIQVIQGFL